MDESGEPGNPSGERLYSIHTAARLLGLSPATLRAWERRHGVPRPRRAANGYRLYTEADLELLHHLKARTDVGVRIGIAVEGVTTAVGGPLSLEALRNRVAEAVSRLDERHATGVLREAFLLHPVEEVLGSIVEPVMIWIGDEWQAERLSIGVEHFASALFVRQLVTLNATSPDPWRPGRALAACMPGDRHEIGLMMLSVGLRRRGWDVRYFGTDLPAPDLEWAAASLRPEVVLLSGTAAAEDDTLAEITALLRRLPEPEPEVVLGGQAFRGGWVAPEGASVLDCRLDAAIAALETILLTRTHGSSER